MRRECAWCRTEMGRVEPHEDGHTTHGICPSCLQRVLQEMRKQPALERATSCAAAGGKGGPVEKRRKGRILIIEDNRDAADSLRLALELLGYEAAVAYSGPDGVQTAKEWNPDLVLSDLGLPGLDGYGVARELRRYPATAETPLIAITGYGQEEDRRRTQEVGFAHHFVKPLDFAALQKVLPGAASDTGPA